MNTTNLARFTVTFLLTLSTALTVSAKSISDSLVKDLDCAGLAPHNVLSRVRPEAFASAHHIPMQNWRANLLGQCWGLALAQRRMFYLARTNVPEAKLSRSLVRYGLDLARGTVPQNCGNLHGENGIQAMPCSEPATPLKVFSIPEASLPKSALFRAMDQGIDGRELRGEIELGQQRRFFNLGNLDLVIQSTELARRRNAATFENIWSSVARGRMPLLIARVDAFTQHAMLVKSILRKDARTYGLVLYDSNRPEAESVIFYRDGLFLAMADAPIGITIRDEDEMDRIEDALFAHYRRLCGN